MKVLLFLCVVLPFIECNVFIADENDGATAVENCGRSELGVGQRDYSSSVSECGEADLLERDLASVCVGNLFRNKDLLPAIIYDALNIGYGTIFQLNYTDTSGAVLTRNVRFNAEFTSGDGTQSEYYHVLLFPAASLAIRTETGSASSSEIRIEISPDFFTDFKLNVSRYRLPKNCRADRCEGHLCIYFAMTDSESCNKCFRGSFGLRSHYGAANIYKTVEVDVRPKGTYGEANNVKKTDFYHIENGDLRPLYSGGVCGDLCIHDDPEMRDRSHCKGLDDCPPGYRETSSGVHYPGLVSDYVYIRETKCVGDTYNICARLHEATPAAYLSDAIIFDERFGGQPRCGCAAGYWWNDVIQICEVCEEMSTHPECTKNTCGGRCSKYEVCRLSEGLEECVCETSHTRYSMNGDCESYIPCDNGKFISQSGAFVCKCNSGFKQLVGKGPCVEIVEEEEVEEEEVEEEEEDCFANLVPCSDTTYNKQMCLCEDGFVIKSGFCHPCRFCEIHEECAILTTGSVTCECEDDYSRYESDSTCLLTTCVSNKVLRLTHDTDLQCTCKEGFLAVEEEDDIICLSEGINNFYSVFYLVLLVVSSDIL